MLNSIKYIFKIVISLTIVASFWLIMVTGSSFDAIKVSGEFINTISSGILQNNDQKIANIRYIDYANQGQYIFKFPEERSIILRLDDVQGQIWDTVVINLTDTVLRNNMSVTLAVIPDSGLDKNPLIRNYIIDKAKDPRIEIAQHGFNHSEFEYLNLSEQRSYELTKLGYNKIVDILGVYPITFISPYGEYGEDAIISLSKLGFKIISARETEYFFDEDADIAHVGYDFITSIDQRELVPVGDVSRVCNGYLEERNLCVVLIHPQDYVNEDRLTLNETKYKEFVKLLNELGKLDAKFITFKDMIMKIS